ncbi:MAG: transcription antitermination factor NusB [Caldisericia bacterium]|nr:transcription antitermination factor NusB [Caldisericia bacterium]
MRVREIAREKALQLLYQKEITSFDIDKIIENFEFENTPEESIIYAVELLRGVTENLNYIDNIIQEFLLNWEWERVLAVDRNILRIGTFELLFKKDIPTAAIIDQAVRIAKKYGSYDDSYKFINGILGRIAERYRSEEET